jgi:GNAT superfamily N-acetyltransferase
VNKILLKTSFEVIILNFKVMRPTVSDTAGILKLSSKIWDGDDYIPYVIEKWFNTTDPLLVVKDMDNDRICAINHATIYGEDAYLEGLRVDPDYTGKGLGKLMMVEMMKEVMKTGANRLFSLMFSESKESMHIAEKYFFDRKNAFYFFEKKISETSVDIKDLKVTVRPIFPEEIARRKSEFSEFLFSAGDYAIDCWTLYPSVDCLENKYIFECDEGKIIAGVHEHERGNFSICLMTEPGDWMAEVLPVVEEYARYFDCGHIQTTFPCSLDKWSDRLLNLGFGTFFGGELPVEESVVFAYELNRPKLDRVIIPGQMEKRDVPENFYRCSKRCKYGFPQVIESYPVKDSQPFPTTFYMICPHLKYHLAQLEESGVIGELDHLKDGEAYKNVNEEYAEQRKSRIYLSNKNGEAFIKKYKSALEVGIGGIRGHKGLKCLHLHAATYLAKFNDPAGRAAMEMLKKKGIDESCEDMNCFRFFENKMKR